MGFADNFFFDLEADTYQKEKVVNTYIVLSFFGLWLSNFALVAFTCILFIHNDVGLIVLWADTYAPAKAYEAWFVVKYILGFIASPFLLGAIVCGFICGFTLFTFIVNFLMGVSPKIYGGKFWITNAVFSIIFCICSAISLFLFTIMYVDQYVFGLFALFFVLFSLVVGITITIFSISKYYLEQKTGGISTNSENVLDESNRSRVEMYVYSIIAGCSVTTIVLLTISSFVNKFGLTQVIPFYDAFFGIGIYFSMGVAGVGCIAVVLAGIMQCIFSILGLMKANKKFSKPGFKYFFIGLSIILSLIAVIALVGISIMDIIVQNSYLQTFTIFSWFIWFFGVAPFCVIPVTGCFGVFFSIFGGTTLVVEIKNSIKSRKAKESSGETDD